MKLSLGPNHKFPCSSNCDFIGINTNFAVHVVQNCENLPSRSHNENSLKNELLDNLLQPQLSQALLERTNLQANLFINLRTIPRTDSTITRLSQSLQDMTPPGDRTESTLRESQTRSHTKTKTSTAKTWSLYRYQAYHENHLSKSGR